MGWHYLLLPTHNGLMSSCIFPRRKSTELDVKLALGLGGMIIAFVSDH